MGNSKYSYSSKVGADGLESYSRADTVRTSFFAAASKDEAFTQNLKRQIHESMSPLNIGMRESRDSELHPNTIPIIVGLDVTGSMHSIPIQLIKEGLPHLMGSIIQNGVPDPALLFLAVGDHEEDRYPLQVGQFESGDKELDMWLTRTYLEGGGGGNAGESYLLAWYFAALHTHTDAWEKRKQKGILFTIGDEPCLDFLPATAIKEITGDGDQKGASAKHLLDAASEFWNVYHLHVMQGQQGKRSVGYWQQLLGKNAIVVEDYTQVPKVMADMVVRHAKEEAIEFKTPTPADYKGSGSLKPEEDILS